MSQGKLEHPSLDLDKLDRGTLLAVLDALPVGAFFLEHQEIRCNPAFEKITGYDSPELSNLDDFFNRLFGAGSREARTLFELDRKAGFPAAREFVILGKDGSAKVVEFTGSGSSRVLCTMQDLTEYVLPERGKTSLTGHARQYLHRDHDGEDAQQELILKALRESEELYRRLSDLTSDYVYFSTRSGADPFKVCWMGGAVERITGYSEAEVFALGCWIGIVHPEDRERVAGRLLGLKPGQDRFDEFRVICKNGAICWIRDTCRCEAGVIAGEIRLFGASQDITASKQAEDALKDIEEIFRLFLEHSPAYLLFKDANHKVLKLSRNFETLLGMPLEEMIGKTAAEVFPPDVAERIRIDDQRVLRSGTPSQIEEELWGRFYSSLKFSIPQKDKPSLVVAIKTDITERKEIEDAILRLNEKLDRRVAQRTAQLETAILEQESFSYSVSHDLRAPLRHINSFSAILCEDFGESLPDQAREYLDRIRFATKRMGVLIDDLLDLSRVSRVQIQRVQVNLSDMAARIALILKETEPERGVQFSIAPGLHANCDPVLVRQLFENLIGNAWKYTGKRVAARIKFGVATEGKEAVYYVKDNGTGFDMAYKDKLFSPFQRLHGAEFEGNGIGLATAQRIVQRHGGNIWAEGAENQGAQFYFTLP